MQIVFNHSINSINDDIIHIGRNKRVIEEYIRNQLEEDFAQDQMSIKE